MGDFLDDNVIVTANIVRIFNVTLLYRGGKKNDRLANERNDPFKVNKIICTLLCVAFRRAATSTGLLYFTRLP